MNRLLIFCSLLLFVSIQWLTNFTEAKNEAVASHKMILINFSGSDWCGPCIRLRKEIFESDTFTVYAKDSLVLVRADFPRSKKNALPPDVVKRNEALAELYNPDGAFPFTVLVDENGKVIRTWNGYPNETPAAFVHQIQEAHIN